MPGLILGRFQPDLQRIVQILAKSLFKMAQNKHNPVILDELITSKIYGIREMKVMLDSDLAELYDVETRRLNEQVKRNIDRFPADFMFQLSQKECERAIKVNIQIMRVFTRMRKLLEAHKEILIKLDNLERKDIDQDKKIMLIFEYLKQLEQAKQ